MSGVKVQKKEKGFIFSQYVPDFKIGFKSEKKEEQKQYEICEMFEEKKTQDGYEIR